MCGVEMVALVNSERVARGDAGSRAVGARARFIPVRADIEAGIPQIIGRRLIADVVDCYSLIVGKQQNVAEARHLAIERLHAETRRPQKFLHGLTVLAEAGVFNDDGRTHHRRIKSVAIHTAPPGREDQVIAIRGAAFGHTHELLDMLYFDS